MDYSFTMPRRISKIAVKYFTYLGWPILVIGIVGTIVATLFVYRVGRDEDKMRLEYEADQAIKRVQYQMERYESVLIQTRAFFLSSTEISKKEFKNYFIKTNLLQRYPGLQGLGLALKVTPNEVKDQILINKKNFSNFKIWPKGSREFYFPIVYLEPEDPSNLKAIGFDMFSEPVREEAMKRAWETGQPSISSKIILVQEDENEQALGFNYYLPYYKDQEDQTIDPIQKESSLIGFIYSPFKYNHLFTSIFADMNLSLNIEIYEGDRAAKDSLIFELQDPQSTYTNNQEYQIIKRIIVGGRNFTLVFYPSKYSENQFPFYAPFFVSIIGFLLTLLIYRIFWITKNQAERSKASEFALQEALRSRDEFLSIASHELKTPLTSLKLQAQLIQRSLKKDDPKAFSKETMQILADQTDRQTHRLIRLVDDMLDISRIRTGRLTIEKEKLDLNFLVRQVVNNMQDQFKQIPNGAPNVTYCENAVGYWDEVRLEQVIINLLTNAIKYGKSQPIDVTISSNENSVILTVRDFGIGIDPKCTEKIFDRFDRGGMSANEISGLGLGLFITKQIVLAHQGEIKVESKLGEGSLFTVELPRNLQE